MRFIDTHTHIYTEEFDADREEVVARAVAAGAEVLLLPNIDESSIQQIEAVCTKWPDVCYPMIGLHPTELPSTPMALLDEMEAKLSASTIRYVAIGEVGVDLYWDSSRREEQIRVFERQADWSIRYDLPLVVHSRAAHREIVDVLSPLAENLPGGVFHCFGGSEDEAAELLSKFPTFSLGIGGVLTFKKSALPQVLKAAVPLSRIVVETDAPYLAPTPYRGKRNEPSYIPLVLHKLAEIYEMPVEEISEVIYKNSQRIFPLSPPKQPF